MLIGIEASRANKLTKTGVEWYAWHVIQELKKLTTEDSNSWILYTNAVLRGGLEVLPANWFEVRAKWLLPYGWTQFRLAWEMIRRPSDVLFLPGSTLPRVIPKKTAVTVHDVGFHKYPQLYKKRQVRIHEIAMREIKRRAARIVTVSEFSKREIAENYAIEPSRIVVVPNGIDHTLYRPMSDLEAVDERLRRYRLAKPFFLAIGRLEAKKNIAALVRAFSEFKTRRGMGDPHKLVLVGIPGYGYEEVKRVISTSSVKDDIIETGYVPEADVPALLNAAEALIHPSWYEGFGIPPVAAMASGCPVLSSNAASLPEIIGPDAALYFSPGHPEAMVKAMKDLVSDYDLRERLRAAGIMRASQYTWQSTAAKLLPILTEWS